MRAATHADIDRRRLMTTPLPSTQEGKDDFA